MFASSYIESKGKSFDFALLWDLAPSFVYCSVFQGSTQLTLAESIASGKYPGYKAYQQRVSMFAPWLTLVLGFTLQLEGKKEEIDRIVYGNGEAAKRE
jgi:hypothetical protein